MIHWFMSKIWFLNISSNWLDSDFTPRKSKKSKILRSDYLFKISVKNSTCILIYSYIVNIVTYRCRNSDWNPYQAFDDFILFLVLLNSIQKKMNKILLSHRLCNISYVINKSYEYLVEKIHWVESLGSFNLNGCCFFVSSALDSKLLNL